VCVEMGGCDGTRHLLRLDGMPGTGPQRVGAQRDARLVNLAMHAAAWSGHHANTTGQSVIAQAFQQQLP
jgi:hypothetical protein